MCFLSFYCNKIQIFSRHPVLLNYTPILHETFFRMTLIQVWTIKRSKDIFFFLTREKQNKTGMFYNVTFYLPQECAMRSSSIESYNTTIYNRLILCKSQEKTIRKSYLFIYFFDGYANSKSVTTGYRGHRDALCPLGQDRNKD